MPYRTRAAAARNNSRPLAEMVARESTCNTGITHIHVGQKQI